jgi:hypothetical protein
MWVDVVKGIVSGVVGILTLVSIRYFYFNTPSLLRLGLILVLVLLEAFFLFWFVFRGDGKKIKVNPYSFLLGVIGGCIISIFLLAALLKS